MSTSFVSVIIPELFVLQNHSRGVQVPWKCLSGCRGSFWTGCGEAANDLLRLGDGPVDIADAQKLAQNPSRAERVCPAGLKFGCYRSCLRAAFAACAGAMGGVLGEPETKGRGGHERLAMLRLVCEGETAPKLKCRSLWLSQTKLKVLRD